MDFSPSKAKFRNVFGDFSRTFNPNDSETQQDSGILYPKRKPLSVNFGVNKLDPNSYSCADNQESRIQRATKLLMDTYNEPSQAEGRYNTFIANQPSEVNYQPSKKRRLGAALAGFGIGLTNPEQGSRVASDIVEEPFRSALSDWTRQEGPLRAAALTESSGRTAKINALKDYISAEHQSAMDRDLIGHRKAQEIQAQSTLSNTIADQQAREAETKAEHQRLSERSAADDKRADLAAAALEADRKLTHAENARRI